MGFEVHEPAELLGVGVQNLEQGLYFGGGANATTLCPTAKGAEDLFDGNLVGGEHREPVLEEDVDARPAVPTLGDLVAPPVLVEVAPVLGFPCHGVSVHGIGLHEDVVLDQVGCQQWGAPIIEGLEDDLRVVASGQVDGDDF